MWARNWESWALKYRRWQTVQRVYDRLFSMHQALKKSGETFEVILGIGLLNWQMESGQRIYRHVLVGQASLQFDPHRGVLSVEPGSDGIRLSLEQDMLEADERPLNELQEACKREVEAVAETRGRRARLSRRFAATHTLSIAGAAMTVLWKAQRIFHRFQ